MKASISIILVALMLMSLVGCTNNVTTTLQLVVVAAEAAVDTLGSTGTIPPAVAKQIDAYLLATSDGVSFATDELTSTDDPGIKAAKIAQKFAAITAPNLPAGTPQNIVAVVAAVSKAVLTFLSTVQSTKAVLVKDSGFSTAFADTNQTNKAKRMKMSSGDRAKLKNIKDRAEALRRKILK